MKINAKFGIILSLMVMAAVMVAKPPVGVVYINLGLDGNGSTVTDVTSYAAIKSAADSHNAAVNGQFLFVMETANSIGEANAYAAYYANAGNLAHIILHGVFDGDPLIDKIKTKQDGVVVVDGDTFVTEAHFCFEDGSSTINVTDIFTKIYAAAVECYAE